MRLITLVQGIKNLSGLQPVLLAALATVPPPLPPTPTLPHLRLLAWRKFCLPIQLFPGSASCPKGAAYRRRKAGLDCASCFYACRYAEHYSNMRWNL